MNYGVRKKREKHEVESKRLKILRLQTSDFRLRKGFTLVEVLVALFILTTGIVAGLVVVNQGLSATQIAKSRLVAANLVQEGIEVVRNIRDTNWIEKEINPALSWDDGLLVGDWEASYQSQSLESYQGRYLKIDANGFYNYTDGNDTKFKRKITIERINNEQLRVIARVEWRERGKNYNLTAVEDLYNWLQ
jgi:prepilin-type N-terminal cleavage/methylation domain-containing protein